MNIKRGAWGVGLLAVGILLGFMTGRASSGIQKVSGPRFLEYAATEPINSASAFALVGVERDRVYGEHWDAVRPLRKQRLVIWTTMSELPPDIVRRLEAGENPWRPTTGPANPVADPTCASDPSWTAPQAPFRIFGNTWHVGPRGLGVFLITAPTGHVLIDGGVPGGAPLIEANIRSLGIDLRDIKWILNSHAHCDHAGGIAQLARDTGAQVIAGAADAPLLARGGLDDPHYGDRMPFPPVNGVRTVTDGETLRLGELEITAHATPGHTKGNTTWTWTSCEGTRCLAMVDVGSLSAPGYRLIGNAKAPDVVEDYRTSFARIAALPCEVALAPHPGMVDFWERVDRRERGAADALVDPALCRAYAEAARESFEKELAKARGK